LPSHHIPLLKVKELKLIQGFPPDYVLKGPVNEQKKFIGNSVETGVVAAWLRAMAHDEIKRATNRASLANEPYIYSVKFLGNG